MKAKAQKEAIDIVKLLKRLDKKLDRLQKYVAAIADQMCCTEEAE